MVQKKIAKQIPELTAIHGQPCAKLCYHLALYFPASHSVVAAKPSPNSASSANMLATPTSPSFFRVRLKISKESLLTLFILRGAVLAGR